MSTVTTKVQTNNQLISEYSTLKLQLGDNEHVKADYTASGDTTLAAGLILGKVAATKKLTALNIAGTDGSQKPAGILFLGLNESILIADGVTESLTLINKGRVAESLLTLPGSYTLDSVIASDDLTVRDYLNAMGIVLEGGEELTDFDNA